jgi:hypothetical protein
MKGRNSLTMSMFSKEFGAPFAPSKCERQVGKAGELPSSFGRREYPPQAIENRKITSVSLLFRNILFSAGKGLAEIGNTLGHISHANLTTRKAQRSDEEHLTKVREGYEGKLETAALR